MKENDGLEGGPTEFPHLLFERLAARMPDAPALRERGRSLAYNELNRRANQLARYLLRRNLGPGERVAICFPRSSDMIVGLLGILKAGAAFVPMDLTLPVSRKLAILNDSGAAILLTADQDSVSTEFDGAAVVTREAQAQIEQEDDSNLEQTGNTVLGVLYTSGVTGKPKGVIVPATAVLNHARWMYHTFPFRRSDVGLMHRSTMLISSTWDYFGPLLGGIPSLVLSENEAADPLVVWKNAVANEVSFVSGSPAFWDAILDHVERRPGEWRTLRLATISGEQVSVRIVRRWQRQFPDACLLNVYGSTECVRPTVYDTSRLSTDAERVPVGTPISNVQIHIVDDQLRPMPNGEQGEICVSGLCLTEGYLNLPLLTEERFIQNSTLTDGEVLFRTGDIGRILADGNLEVTGRRDQQVKIRGYRVELGDVEAALLQFSAIRQAVVVAMEDATSGKRLIAYLVSDVEPPPSPTMLRDFLASKLPDYMIPAFFVAMKDLPLTRSGKTDWNALLDPTVHLDVGDREPKELIGATEESLAVIWSEVFNIDDIGRADDFYDLGGHSVMAMQIASRVLNTFGVELPIEVFLSCRTLGAMAKFIDDLSCPAPALTE